LLVVGAWLAITGIGYWTAVAYQSNATPVGAPPVHWPPNCDLPRYAGHSTLLVFLHPKCPCSRATLNELDRLLSRFPNRMTVNLVFRRPKGAPEGWEQSELWFAAAAISGVNRIADDGVYSRLLCTAVTGECLLYSADGKLQFHGGITPGRGHQGDSAGQVALAAALLER